jgi:hypothetical protein
MGSSRDMLAQNKDGTRSSNSETWVKSVRVPRREHLSRVVVLAIGYYKESRFLLPLIMSGFLTGFLH